YAAASADVDHSGYPDLILANDYGVDQIFLNQQGKGFVNAAQKVGIGFVPKSGMNVSLGDIMNRGKFAIYITNISEPGVLIQGNSLWVPVVPSEKLRYQNLAGDLGIELGGWSYGAQFGDLNLDGNLDLYVANGYVSAEKGTDYWYDFSKVAGGNQKIIADAKNWPAMKGRSLSGYQENKIWLNDGAGKFQEVADAVGGSLNLDSRAVALADLDNDGTLEILVASQRAPFKIFKNTVVKSHNWIGFKLKGIKSNSSAIGAEVEISWDSNHQVQIVNSTSGFSAENQRPVYFGLGTTGSVEKAVIRWPSGYKQTIRNPEINKLHTITESMPS
ncbi:MAG: CRTAC1 family protein, partial [Balneolaceae bacterium]